MSVFRLVLELSFHGLAPFNLSGLLLSYEPVRSLRSLSCGHHIVPKIQIKSQGEAAFNHFNLIYLNICMFVFLLFT